MKIISRFLYASALFTLVLLLTTSALDTSTPIASAQTGGGYDLMWSTIDGGGGTSSGGAYSLSGTIGQPDAGTSTGGAYTLNGGFWNDALNALQRLFLPLIQR